MTLAQEVHSKATCFDRKFVIGFSPRTIKINSETSVHVTRAEDEDIQVVNRMIYQASRSGQGFALDEFNQDNMFAGRLLRKADVLVAKDANNSIMAAAIVGPTHYCRSASTDILGGYVIVNKDHRRKGIGKKFAQYLLEETMESSSNYSGVITDVFVTDIPATMFVKSLKFSGIGLVLNSGTLATYGAMNCMVMYYPLHAPISHL
jgi:L-amino acid N-acyltransferase YncA